MTTDSSTGDVVETTINGNGSNESAANAAAQMFNWPAMAVVRLLAANVNNPALTATTTAANIVPNNVSSSKTGLPASMDQQHPVKHETPGFNDKNPSEFKIDCFLDPDFEDKKPVASLLTDNKDQHRQQIRKRKNTTSIDNLISSVSPDTENENNGAKRQQRPKRGQYRLDRNYFQPER